MKARGSDNTESPPEVIDLTGSPRRIDSRASSIDLTGSPRPQGAEEAEGRAGGSSLARTPISVLSWNIWFGELEMEARMRSIGSTIQSLSPDIMCFQEVTGPSLQMLANQQWYQSGEYELYGEIERGVPYFIVLLFKTSKFNAVKKNAVPFTGSIMGRQLLYAVLETKTESNLFMIGTTHLESPCPDRRTGRFNLYSQERKMQCEHALQIFRSPENASRPALFIGDMNWNDNRDGPPPLLPDFLDAWEAHGEGEGYTYDGPRNGNVFNYNKLRLDRAFFRGNDKAELTEISMVGDAPVDPVIPNNRMVRRRLIEQNVFPSDHFGLLVQLSLFSQA